MNTLTATSVVLPAPRPAINQGIDINNEMVLNHTAIYENCLTQVTQENTVENALMLLDPYGTAPLSAYAGVWSLESAEIIVTVQDAAKTAIAGRTSLYPYARRKSVAGSGAGSGY